MDQSKLIGELANDVSNDTENQIPASRGATEIRALSELELMLAGGGDTVIIW